MTAVLRRGVWVVVVVAVLLGALGAAYVVRADSRGVTSQAQLVVTGRAATTSQDNAFTASQYVDQRMSTYAEVATSDVVVQPAAAALGVDETDLAGAIRATVPGQTTVLALTVSGTDPQQAQRRAQAVLTALSSQITQLETQAGNPTRVDVRTLSAASLPAGSSLPSAPLAGVAGFAIGLLLALAGLAATHLLRPRDQSQVAGPASGTPAASAEADAADPVPPAVSAGAVATVPAKAAAKVPAKVPAKAAAKVPPKVPAKAAATGPAKVAAKVPARTGATPRKATRASSTSAPAAPRAAARAKAVPSGAARVTRRAGAVDETDTGASGGRITGPAADLTLPPAPRVDGTTQNGSSAVSGGTSTDR